jgi:hypothetical protein
MFSYFMEMDPREIGWEGVDWMHMVQDRDQWLACVNMVMNFGFCKGQGIS